MTKKYFFTTLVLHMLWFSSFTFASAWTFEDLWIPSSQDWFDGNNWTRADMGYGTRPSNPNQYAPPDWAVWAAMEPKGDARIASSSPFFTPGGASCSFLVIQPWSWIGAFNETLTLIDCNMNCGLAICVCSFMPFSSETEGHGVLDVNGGTMTTPGLRNFDPCYPDDPHKYYDPNYPYITGDGLHIGGNYGSYEIGDNYGIVNIRNNGKIIVPRIRFLYGIINLYGGLLYDTNEDISSFYISENHSMNKIYIDGGELRLAGDHMSIVNDYICKGILCTRSGRLQIDYRGRDMSITSQNTPGSYGSAYEPSPKYQAQNISRTPSLSWKSGQWIQKASLGGQHAIYFGTDYNAVNNATTNSIGIYKGRQDPCVYEITIPLEKDTTYYWRIDEYNDANSYSPWKGCIWQFRTLGGQANNPNPSSGNNGLSLPLQLSWIPGAFAARHELYIDTDKDNVTNASLSYLHGTSEVNLIGNTYILGNLPWDLARDTDYYWRVDEANNENPHLRWKGETWKFRNTNYFIIDDFNSYQTSEDMNVKWNTNFYNNCGETPHAGLSLYKNENTGFMRFVYDNNLATKYSETRFVTNYGSGADWTGGGALPSGDPINSISISYLGDANNTADPVYDRMYMAIEDSFGNLNVVQNPDTNATKNSQWEQWQVALSDLAVPPVSLYAVKYLYIGIGQRCNNVNNDSKGIVYFDDMHLWQKHCVSEYGPMMDWSGDCKVGLEDLKIFCQQWLNDGDADFSSPADHIINFKDFNIFVRQWKTELLWP